jgi:hypothetical protein
MRYIIVGGRSLTSSSFTFTWIWIAQSGKEILSDGAQNDDV